MYSQEMHCGYDSTRWKGPDREGCVSPDSTAILESQGFSSEVQATEKFAS